MKYRLTEEQLNSLITESTMRILRETSEDEGIGGAIGKGLGWLARKTANGVKDFGSNFKQQWQGQQNQNAENGGQNTDQSNTNQNTGQNTNQNTGQNTNQNTGQNTNQNTDQSNTNQEQVIQQLQGQIKQLNQKITGLEQQVTNAAYGGMSDDDYADSEMNVGGQPQKKTPAQQGPRKSYSPNLTFSQQSYDQGKANGGDSRAKYESKMGKKATLSEAYLSKIIKESVKHVLSEVGDTSKGQRKLGALQARKVLGAKGDTESEFFANQKKGSEGVYNYAKKQRSHKGDDVDDFGNVSNPLYGDYSKGYVDYFNSHPDERAKYNSRRDKVRK